MWLNPSVFEWRANIQTSSLYEDLRWKRPHQIWAHVEQILSRPTIDLDLANAIMDLKRAVDSRVRMLKDRYSLRNLPL